MAIGEENNEEQILVDGQQRLTTMTIFLTAIEDNISNLNKEYNPGIRKHLIRTFSDTSGKEVFTPRLLNKKLEPLLPISLLNLDEDLACSELTDPKNDSQDWLISSYEWFKSELTLPKLVERITKKAENDYKMDKLETIDLLRKLSDQLLNSTIIIINTTNAETSNILYRNFNSRGLPLRESDLIKNELFARVGSDTTAAVKLWETIEKNVRSVNTDLDTFLYHYMKSKYSTVTALTGRKKQLGKKDTFDVFLEMVPQTKESYSDFFKNLCIESNYYKIMSRPTDSDKLFGISNYFKQNSNIDTLNYLNTLTNLKTSQVKILLLGLFNFRAQKDDFNTIFRKAIKLISMHQTLHVVCTSPSNKLLPIYSRYGQLFNECSTKEDGNKLLSKLQKELNSHIPEVQTAYSTILNLNYDHNIKAIALNDSQKRNFTLLKSILENISIAKQIELSVNTSNKAFKPIYDATIEHIVNQSSEIQNRFNIGNLILIEQSKHEDHENILDKKSMYKNSDIEYTKSFNLDDFYTSSTKNMEKSIQKRGQKLAQEFRKVVLNLDLKK